MWEERLFDRLHKKPGNLSDTNLSFILSDLLRLSLLIGLLDELLSRKIRKRALMLLRWLRQLRWLKELRLDVLLVRLLLHASG